MQTEMTHPAAEVLPAWRAMTGNRPLAGLTVLVVEDSRFASEAVRLLCLRSGARIRRADSLQSAQRHLATYRPAVVIVDMGLPDGDGSGLIAELSAMRPRVPVILGVSGDPDRRDDALAAGAQAFLPKPVESLAAFQQTILGALPVEARPLGLRALPTDVIVPDAGALRDDLAHVATLLGEVDCGPRLTFVARFVEGLAVAARDVVLARAAAEVITAPEAPAARELPRARLAGLIARRLSELQTL